MENAGWYQDPERSETWRYWDGSAWTEHRAPMGRRNSDMDTIVALLVGLVFIVGLVFVLALAL